MEEQLIQSDDPFIQYVDQFPALRGPVNGALFTLHQMPFTSELLNDSALPREEKIFILQAARDAAATIAAIAREGGFEDVAHMYSCTYDRYCRALLTFWREVA